MRDTHRQAIKAQDESFKLWNHGVVGLVGASSSNPTAAAAQIAGLSLIKLVLVGFRASSPILSDQEMFPTFLRTNPTIRGAVNAFHTLMDRKFFVFRSVGLSDTVSSASQYVYVATYVAELVYTRISQHLLCSRNGIPWICLQTFVGRVQTSCTRPLIFSPQPLTKLSNKSKTFG